ncbi:MAG: hypothetical protein ACI8PT_003816 [Gammaproteobacteria bacterium]|jgi:hypothetical protein
MIIELTSMLNHCLNISNLRLADRILADRVKSGQLGVEIEVSFIGFRLRVRSSHLSAGPPAFGAASDDEPVMQQPVDHGRDGGGVAEQLTPLVDRSVGPRAPTPGRAASVHGVPSPKSPALLTRLRVGCSNHEVPEESM